MIMSPRHVITALFLVGVTSALLRAQTTPPTSSPEELARALQKHYNEVRDFKASFVQTSGGGVLRVNDKGEGTVAVKKPGRMRWDYTRPEKQQIVSDGARIYSCYLDTKECDDPQPMPKDDEAPTATLFLAGRADILRDFRVARVESPVAGTLALRLDPRKPDPDYEYLVVAFHPTTYQIRGLKTRNRQAGETTIVFNDIKENTGIPDKTFTPPAAWSSRRTPSKK